MDRKNFRKLLKYDRSFRCDYFFRKRRGKILPTQRFPNPTNGIVTIKLANGATLKNTTIYNMTGQKLSESITNTVDFSNLANGVYILQMETSDGKTESKRIVKQ